MYEELVKRLQHCSEEHSGCGMCELSDTCVLQTKLLLQSADAIAQLNKRIDFLMNCIYEAEDALDRGVDNEWARASLEKAERGQDDV